MTRMTVLCAMLLGSTPMAWAGKSVFLAESLVAKNATSNGAALEGPYCVAWAHITLADWEANYAGTSGASYSCGLDFVLDRTDGASEVAARRTITYRGSPSRMERKTIGDKAKDRFGFFGFFSVIERSEKAAALDQMIFIAPNSVLAGLYGTLGFLSDVMEGDPEKNKLNLVPKFDAVFDSMQTSCEVIAQEIKGAACNDEVGDRIDKQLALKASLQDAYRRLVPAR